MLPSFHPAVLPHTNQSKSAVCLWRTENGPATASLPLINSKDDRCVAYRGGKISGEVAGGVVAEELSLCCGGKQLQHYANGPGAADSGSGLIHIGEEALEILCQDFINGAVVKLLRFSRGWSLNG